MREARVVRLPNFAAAPLGQPTIQFDSRKASRMDSRSISSIVRRVRGRLTASDPLLTLRAQQALNRHDWPGNVRELENVLGHARMFAEAEIIDIHHLPEYLRTRTQTAVRSEGMVSLEELQRSYARRVLEHVEGNKARAAEVLGISRTTLYSLLRENKPDATC
jgi:DNA-binding NtrC family response regulator